MTTPPTSRPHVAMRPSALGHLHVLAASFLTGGAGGSRAEEPRKSRVGARSRPGFPGRALDALAEPVTLLGRRGGGHRLTWSPA
jgi:hypothetical protein